MKRRILAFAACAALGLFAADVKLATRDWVTSQLMASGIRISAATTTRNTNGTFTVTVPFTSPDVTNCVSLSLTFTNPRITQPQAQPVLRGAKLMRGAATVQDEKLVITLTEGSWKDSVGTEHVFVFSGGFDFTWPSDLPEVPSEDHVCELDVDCNCVWMNKVPKYPDDYPEEYRLATMEDFDNADFGNVLTWIDTSTWPDQTEAAGKVRYWITDTNGNRFNLEQIGKTDLWRNAVGEAMEKLNERFRECCEAFAKSCECNATNPQHDWNTKTCGSHSWSVCRNNSAHTQGTEGHDFPYVGGNYTATHHSCKCGDRTEAHGTLVTDGTKTATYNSDGKETGWTQTWVCPKGCGYSKTVTHTHHFTNCGVCDTDDESGCSTVCTGCSGDHVFGEPANGKCAKCECTMCSDCNAHPPYTETAKHAGWHPCGEADEEDNDNADGSANGAHCACQCLAWGHNAALSGVHESKHDYQFPTGFSRHEQISDASATDYAKTYHYKLIGKCSREGCGRWKKVRESHTWPENPTRYAKISESTCRSYYACTADGCGYEKHEDGNHAPTGGTVYEAITVSGSPKCRQKRLCANCEAYVSDDTNDHVRGDNCKCANGCGYQFDHAWAAQDACGNVKCSHCETYKYSQESHAGYKSGGTYSAAGHQCACGMKPDVPHVYGTPTVVSQAGWSTILRHTCTACPYYYDEEVNTNPCRNGHVALQSECGCACGYYSPSNNVSTSRQFHKWDSSDMDSDGVENCMCKCNTLHTFKSSIYLNNSGTRCPNVCAYCRLRKRDGTYAYEDDHEPKASSFERCGCACGRLDSSAKASKFHIPKPGTCTCYGGDGNGGTRHFKHPKTGCTRICAYLKDGQEHLTAARDGEEGTTAAYPKDHTKTDTTGLCGCKCRKYDGDEAECPSTFHVQNPTGCGCYCTHSSKEGHHRWASNSCYCYCEERKEDHKWTSGQCYCLCGRNHRNIQRQDGKCPRVCHGPCNEYLYARDKHTPNDDSCGCECGQFAGADYTDLTFHHGNGSPYCMCACGLHHINSYRRLDCTSICSQCGDKKTNYALVDPLQAAPSAAHSWTADSCYCKCGKFVDHKFASDSCTCFCEATQRAHLWIVQEDGVTGTYTCGTCGNTISEHDVVYNCSRCGESLAGHYETGHAPTCGEAHDNDENYDPCGCSCTGCGCSACENGKGRCTTCGNLCGDEDEGGGGAGGGSGGSTGGGGGYRDI